MAPALIEGVPDPCIILEMVELEALLPVEQVGKYASCTPSAPRPTECS